DKFELDFAIRLLAFPRVTIMADAFACPSCSKAILPKIDGRLPPWCPHCGVDMKLAAASTSAAPAPAPSSPPQPVAPPVAATPFGAAGVIAPRDEVPTETYFHACVPAFSVKNHRLFRIYVMPSDLLVFALGGCEASEDQALPQAHSPATQGGAGAMATLQQSKPLNVAGRVAELDAADAMTLRQIAESGDGAFVVGRDDVKSMTLAGPSFWWSRICKVRHEGLLKFDHRKQGQLTYALLRLRDARRAAEYLPRLFPDRLEISLSWCSAGRR